jgi:hypothetical protein
MSSAPYRHRLVRVKIRPDKTTEAREWIEELSARRSENLKSMERENLFLDSLYTFETEGDLWIYWVLVQKTGASTVDPLSNLERSHLDFLRCCTEIESLEDGQLHYQLARNPTAKNL